MWLQELEKNRELKAEYLDQNFLIKFLPCCVILRESIENQDSSSDSFLATILSQDNTLQFPVILKSNSASSKKYSHLFRIVQHPEDLYSEVQKAFGIYVDDDKLLIQSYIEESKYVVKCYATNSNHYLKIQENLTEEEKLELASDFRRLQDYKKSNLKCLNSKENVLPSFIREKLGKMS